MNNWNGYIERQTKQRARVLKEPRRSPSRHGHGSIYGSRVSSGWLHRRVLIWKSGYRRNVGELLPGWSGCRLVDVGTLIHPGLKPPAAPSS
jgi:hypothetical protein